MSMTREEWDRRLGATDNHPLAKSERNPKIWEQRQAGWLYKDIAAYHKISQPAVGKIVRRGVRRGLL